MPLSKSQNVRWESLRRQKRLSEQIGGVDKRSSIVSCVANPDFPSSITTRFQRIHEATVHTPGVLTEQAGYLLMQHE